MARWRLSANLAFFGATADRFTQYQPDRDLEERFALAAQVDGLEGVELKYPADFADVERVRALLGEHGLALSAVNVGTKDAEHWRFGALMAREEEARCMVIRRLREGMDLAAELGAGTVTTCPLADAYDYPFQLDYSGAWQRLLESVRAVAEHRPDVSFCLEYQPHEPHAHVLLDNVGKLLHVCAEVGFGNVGANLDVGHAIAAGEAPAESAALLASKNRLFYMHSNDNTGDGGDWDMISGAVHFWHWMELLYVLDRLKWTGWLGADILAKHLHPTAAFQTNVRMIQRMQALLERIGADRIEQLLATDGNSAEVYDLLSSHLGADV